MRLHSRFAKLLCQNAAPVFIGGETKFFHHHEDVELWKRGHSRYRMSRPLFFSITSCARALGISA
jgi:hypothetical protein